MVTNNDNGDAASLRRDPAQAAAQPSENVVSAGGQGALFRDRGHERADARMAAHLISLGVVSIEQAETLLRAGFTLAAKAASKNDCRGYAACMRVAIEVAKLEQNAAEQQPVATAPPKVVLLDWRRQQNGAAESN